MGGSAAVFLSYAHEDDKASRGRVIDLATAVMDEFSLLTGRPLELFLDRKSIEWGDAWRRRIDDALDSSTVLVPVVTPRYFQRAECRREFVEFYGPAEGLGLRKLIMPVLFAKVPEFNESNPDELIATTSRFHHSDWTDLRLVDHRSETLMRAVNAMAVRIQEALAEIQADEKPGLLASREVSGDAGALEVMGDIERILPDWLNAVEEDEVVLAQYYAIGQTYRQREARARPALRVSIMYQEATAQRPVASRLLELSQVYYARTLELHPLITSLIRFVRLYPEHSQLLKGVNSAVDEAMIQIRQGRVQSSVPGRVRAIEYWGARAHLSRVMADLVDFATKSTQYRKEANALVEGWSAELSALSDSADA